jgi:DNA-binding NtrC family response regulator
VPTDQGIGLRSLFVGAVDSSGTYPAASERAGRGTLSSPADSALSLTVSPLVGTSQAFLALKERLFAVARVQRTTLITGATGTGKDLITRFMHEHSERSRRPYVPVHCAALPENLVEAELFGHLRGAFTGALQARDGLIRTASQGTLFLDEVDSLSLSAQAKLLRFLETGEYRAVGSDRRERSDAWVIAATNRNLHESVQRGIFRADLLYRLQVVQIEIPALKQRPADILPLADHFLTHVSGCSKNFSHDARVALEAHDWPGNVRELRHRVEAAALLSSSATIDALALGFGRPAPKAQDSSPKDAVTLEGELWSLIAQRGLNLVDAVSLCERVMIQAALQAEGNNRTRAADRLGIHVRTLYKKLSG